MTHCRASSSVMAFPGMRRSATLVSALLFTASAAAQEPSPSPSPAPASFALTICAVTADGTSIPGATVIIVAPDGSAAARVAGDDGCARIEKLPALTYKVTVAAPGAKPSDF